MTIKTQLLILTRTAALALIMITIFSAGVGRTGTYIALDMLMQQMEEKGSKASVDVFETMKRMREDRVIMIQTVVRPLVQTFTGNKRLAGQNKIKQQQTNKKQVGVFSLL